MLNFLSLTEELVSGLLDLGNAVSIVQLESLDNLVFAVGGGAGHTEHETLGDTVGLAVGVEADALPLFATGNPVAHVVDGGITS